MKSLAEALERMLKVYDIAQPIRQNEALFIWQEVVGEAIARHTQPEKVVFGKLYVNVDSPTWRNELIFRKKEILNNLNARLKEAKLKEIILR